jgi:enterochelin esterase-like enzyme
MHMPDRPSRSILARLNLALMLGLVLLLPSLPARAGQGKQHVAPKVPAGHLVHLDRFPSQYVAPHDVNVWLPPDYPKHAPYAVLYMFDGQNLFGNRKGSAHSWQAAGTAAKLIAHGKVRPFIIVGIANAGTLRMSEYYP